MRLTAQERQTIRAAGLQHFGVTPRLFGSRLDDSARGRDIDLFIPGAWAAAEAVPRRLRFCAALATALGERKIDVLVDDGQSSSPILELARTRAEPL